MPDAPAVPDVLAFDFDRVTPRMLMDFKKHTGTSLMSLASNGDEIDLATMDETLIAGFVWLALRMGGQPEATWDEACDTPFLALTFDEAAGEGEAPDPTPAG